MGWISSSRRRPPCSRTLLRRPMLVMIGKLKSLEARLAMTPLNVELLGALRVGLTNTVIDSQRHNGAWKLSQPKAWFRSSEVSPDSYKQMLCGAERRRLVDGDEGCCSDAKLYIQKRQGHHSAKWLLSRALNQVNQYRRYIQLYQAIRDDVVMYVELIEHLSSGLSSMISSQTCMAV